MHSNQVKKPISHLGEGRGWEPTILWHSIPLPLELYSRSPLFSTQPSSCAAIAGLSTLNMGARLETLLSHSQFQCQLN